MDIQVFVNEIVSKRKYIFEWNIIIDELNVVLNVDLTEGSMWIQSDDTEDTLYEIDIETELNVESILSTIQKIVEKLDQLYYYKPMGK